eukprot:gene7993-10811_t
MKFTPSGGQVKINMLCEMQNQENHNKIISKQPLAPLITDYPPQPEVGINDPPMQSSDRDRELSSQVMSTPERRKPRPSTPPLTGSAIYVVDT